MRDLSKFEKKNVKYLVEARKNNRYDQMQFAYILRHFVTYDYISWERKEYGSYIKTFLQGNKADSKDVFYKIIDVIGLFMELQEKGYILLAGTNLSPLKYPRFHFDKAKFENFDNSGLLIRKGNDISIPAENKGDEINIYYGEIVDIIEKYMDSIVYPLQSLVDYQKHCFKTVEQRRFFWTSIISFIAIGVAIFIGYKSWHNDICINEDQLQRIENALKVSSSSVLDSIKIQQFDTLEIKVLAPHIPVVKSDTSANLASKPQQDPSKQSIPKN